MTSLNPSTSAEVPTASSNRESESKLGVKTDDDDKSSVYSVDHGCRICFDTTKEEGLVNPCYCKGTMGDVHVSCLERWLATTNSHFCELCHFRFATSRRPRYKVIESIFLWLFGRIGNQRQCTSCEVIILMVWTPVILAAVYASLSIAMIYTEGKESNIGTSWANIALTFLAVMFAVAYYLWLNLFLKACSRNWYRWWQGNNVVRLLRVSRGTTMDTNVLIEGADSME